MPKTAHPHNTSDKKLPKSLSKSAGLSAPVGAVESKARHLVKRRRDIEELSGIEHEVHLLVRRLSSDVPSMVDVERRIVAIEKALERIRALNHTVETVGLPAPSAAEITNLRRNAQARKAFLSEFGTLTSREVAEHAGSRAANKAALANRWKAEGRIFAVEMGGQTLFPAFQFSSDDGHPRPIIAEILAILQPKLSGWQTALWFSGRNGWLGAERPVDILISDPNAVADAARQEDEAFD